MRSLALFLLLGSMGMAQEGLADEADRLFQKADYPGIVSLLEDDFKKHACTPAEYKYYAAAQLKRWERAGELVRDFSRKFTPDTRISFALSALEEALKADPTDTEAIYLQGVACGLLHRWSDAENHMTMVAGREIAFNYGFDSPQSLLLESLKHQKKYDRVKLLAAPSQDVRCLRQLFEVSVLEGDFGQSVVSYNKLVDSMSDDEIASLFNEITMIADDEEKTGWPTATDKAAFLKTFWKKRDPNLADDANERLTDHYRRLLHASEYYSKATDPELDDRGLTYVRLGPPSRIYYGGDGAGLREYESWIYSHLGLHFDFVQKYKDFQIAPLTDALGPGLTPQQRGQAIAGLVGGLESEHNDYFRISRLRSNGQFAEQISQQQFYDNVKNTDLIYFDVAKYHPLQLNARAACFRAEDGMTRLDLYYMAPLAEFMFETEPSAGKTYVTQIDVTARLFDKDYNQVASSEFSRMVEAGEDDITRLFYVDEIRSLAKPGTYLMAFQIKNGEKTGVYQFPVTIPSFEQGSLEVSDVQLAVRVGDSKLKDKFVKPGSGVKVLPNPAAHIVRNRDLALYYEIYGLTLDNDGQSRYEVTYGMQTTEQQSPLFEKIGRWFSRNKTTSLATGTTRNGRRTNETEFVMLDIRNLPSGQARLDIKVKDLNSGIEKTTGLILQIE